MRSSQIRSRASASSASQASTAASQRRGRTVRRRGQVTLMGGSTRSWSTGLISMRVPPRDIRRRLRSAATLRRRRSQHATSSFRRLAVLRERGQPDVQGAGRDADAGTLHRGVAGFGGGQVAQAGGDAPLRVRGGCRPVTMRSIP
ncbi:hypothetical protein ADK70_25735 [Streptomyces rimosus subsp. pseudoverticillatus]|nr:hypothetical protein ADK70_25735 [Streptomyces rimosus subsp. pseudoverticillatus]